MLFLVLSPHSHLALNPPPIYCLIFFSPTFICVLLIITPSVSLSLISFHGCCLHRKRRRVGDNEEEQQLNPQAKRSGGSHDTLVSDLGRDVWDSEVILSQLSSPLTSCSNFPRLPWSKTHYVRRYCSQNFPSFANPQHKSYLTQPSCRCQSK